MAKEIQTQIHAIEKQGILGSDGRMGLGRDGSRRGNIVYSSDQEHVRRNSVDATGRRFTTGGVEVEHVREDIRECFNDAMHTSASWGATDGALEGAAQRRASLASGVHSIYSVYPELTEMKDLLIKTKNELQKKANKLEQNEEENQHKLELERRHFHNTRELLIQQHQEEIHKFSKDIGIVKKDAKIVIDFVRRKANEALDVEIKKRKSDKSMMDRELRERERNMRERFNQRLENVEKQVKHALNREHFVMETKHARRQDGAIDSLSSSPSQPRPPRRPTLAKHNSNKSSDLRIHVPSRKADDSIEGDDVRDNGSISTHEGRHFTFTDNREWFEERINQLDEWTDTLASTLNVLPDVPFDEGGNTPTSPSSMPHPPSPPPVRRISSIRRWEL